MGKFDCLYAPLDRRNRQRADLVVDKARHCCRRSGRPVLVALVAPGDKALEVTSISAERLFRIGALATGKNLSKKSGGGARSLHYELI